MVTGRREIFGRGRGKVEIFLFLDQRIGNGLFDVWDLDPCALYL